MRDYRSAVASFIRIENKPFVRELLAECIGTFFLVLIGNSANIQAAAASIGNSTSAHIAWGIGFMFGCFLAASVSGAHLNPAICVSQFLLGNFPLWKVLPYCVVQVVGAYLGAGVAYFGHYDDLHKLDGGNRTVTGYGHTAELFVTFPKEHMTVWGSVLDQIIGTAMLSGLIHLITDKRHNIPAPFVPPLAGSIVTMIAMTFGANAGFAMNPARDLGPRLLCLCVGYGSAVFSAHGHYFWIPLFVPFIGAIIGAAFYKLFVGLHGPAAPEAVENPPIDSPTPTEESTKSEYSLSFDDNTKATVITVAA